MYTNKSIEFTTNSFASNPIGSIVTGTFVGMLLMSVSIVMGLPIVVSMIFLIGGILLVYGFTIGKTTYAICDEGIVQTIRRFIPHTIFNKSEDRFISWSDIRSYKSDFDVGKSMIEYEYLKISIRKRPYKIWITDQIDRAGFQKFRDDFINRVDEVNEKIRLVNQSSSEVSDNNQPTQKSEKASNTETDLAMTGQRTIERKRGFYHTKWAKGLTIFFVILVVLIQFYSDNFGLSAGSAFKLKFVLIPGTLYMIYRTFRSK